jgi:SAM-dependent methyltransferase
VRGFVPTPDHLVDAMVAKLFDGRPPRPDSVLLDPGCGTGAFIHGVARWCQRRANPLPKILGVESDPVHAAEAKRSLRHLHSVTIANEDFLAHRSGRFDFVIGNPPYVPITALSAPERREYRKRYSAAVGRFDLYLLFFEEALRLLNPGGRLVFVTPEKFLYVRTAAPLRKTLAKLSVEEIQLIDEGTFGELITYPTVTSLVNTPVGGQTRVSLRDGSIRHVHLATDGSSWLPAMNGSAAARPGPTLADVCVRISCGVATGADSVFVTKAAELNPKLKRFAYPTIAGRELSSGEGLMASHSILVPYSRSGTLLREGQLGELGAYLSQPERRRRLLQRTCVARKPWYAFHENPPLADMLRPKILCKDITARPFFVIERTGEVLPRHSVYYLVPREPSAIDELCDYLNSGEVCRWLAAHCQRAASGFLRLQSHVLKRIPVPPDFAAAPQLAWYGTGVASA